LFKNARINIDTVQNLGNFIEIEIIINTDSNENELMEYLIKILNIQETDKISLGYRELLLSKSNINKDLKYYSTTHKFLVVNKDILDSDDILFKANEIVPCIYVEEKNNEYYILQLDQDIQNDHYKYTMWRKFVGLTYNTKITVFLIKHVENSFILYDLNGKVIDFNSLQKNGTFVDKTYLAKFAYLSIE
jgi:hypothetical protein